MPWSPLSLADLHLEVLDGRDDAGLMHRRHGAASSAPDFHLVRTVEGNRWLLSAALPEEAEEGTRGRAVSCACGCRTGRHGGPRARPERRPATVRAQRVTGEPAFGFPDPLQHAPGSSELLRDPRGARIVPELAWIREVTSAQQPVTVACNSSGDGPGNSPLSAVYQQRNDVARLLIERGADVNQGDNAGWTPLHLAAANGYVESARKLLHAGADPKARTVEAGGKLWGDKTPLDLLSNGERKRDEGTPVPAEAGAKMRSLLREHGAS